MKGLKHPATVVAMLALLVALSGGAMAGNAIQVGTPAGGDLNGTYPNPTIAPGKVTNGDLANSSLSVNTDGTTLTGGGSIALGGSNSTPLGVASGGVGTTQLADGAVTSSKFATDAEAPNAAKLDGLDPSAFLANSRVPTTGFVSLFPGTSQTVLNVNHDQLILVCVADPNGGLPTTKVQIAADNNGNGGFAGIFSADTNSEGAQGGNLFDGSPVEIASSSAGVDSGRFDALSNAGNILDGTFFSYTDINSFCHIEAIAITDNGPSGLRATKPLAPAVAK